MSIDPSQTHLGKVSTERLDTAERTSRHLFLNLRYTVQGVHITSDYSVIKYNLKSKTYSQLFQHTC